jgi:hypothetical protein
VVVDGYLELDSPGPVAESELLADFYDAVRGMSRLTGEYPAISSTDADLDQVLRSSAVAMFGTDRGLTEAAEAFCRRIYRVFLNMTQTLESYRPEPAEVDLLILLAKDNQTLEQWRSVVAGELTAEVLESDLYGHQLCIQEAPSLAARTLDYLGEQ